MSGTLVYDSIEDGIINYAFTAKSGTDKLETQDISENGIFPKDIALYTTGTNTLSDDFKKIRNGSNEMIKAPALVIKGADIAGLTAEDMRLRYINHPNFPKCLFVPAVQMYQFLVDAFGPSLEIDDYILSDLKKLYLLCPYKPELSSYEVGFDGHLKVNDTMPKVTKLDMVLGLSRIFGSNFYVDGDIYKLISSRTVLNESDIINWSDRVSDKFSSSKEPATGLSLHFEDDSSENTYDGTQNSEDEIYRASSFYDVAMNRTLPEEGEYVAVQHIYTGDIYSYTRRHFQSTINLFPTESLLRANESINYPVKGSDDICEFALPFKLVRPVPEPIYMSGSKVKLLMAPVVTPPSLGEERGSDAFIGIIEEGQMTDKGWVAVPVEGSEASGMNVYKDKSAGFLLCTPYKYNEYLIRFKTSSHQVVNVDLDLSTEDVAECRMYNRYNFAGREWLARKISITVDVASGTLESSGEFVSI